MGQQKLVEFIMLLTVSLAILCALGVAFYMTFMYALCKECARPRVCSLVCVRTHHPDHAIPEESALDASILRAA
jgi:hypothetical protein